VEKGAVGRIAIAPHSFTFIYPEQDLILQSVSIRVDQFLPESDYSAQGWLLIIANAKWAWIIKTQSIDYE
jgi:hypothetical protein